MNMLSFATEWTLAYCGFTALSLGMDRHHADIHGRGSVPGKQQRIRLQASGPLALMASYFIRDRKSVVRERVCKYVEFSVVAVTLKKKENDTRTHKDNETTTSHK